MQTRFGNLPDDALGCWYIGTEDSGPLNGWALVRRPSYGRAASATDHWRNFKLVSYRPRKGAANYWLGWDMNARRFARTRELARIPEPVIDALQAALTDPLLLANFTPTAETAALAELRSLMGDTLGGMLD